MEATAMLAGLGFAARCVSEASVSLTSHTAIRLRVCWIWRMHTNPLRPWRGLDMQFSKAELDVFAASTSMVLGNGESSLFWEDRWLDGKSVKEMAPEVYALVPKRRRKVRTVRETLIDCAWIPDIVGAPSALALWQYVQLWGRLRDIQLSPDQDRMVWRWSTDGQYTSPRAIISGSWELNWKTWAPPRVKFFIWLACLDRCWTSERPARRGLPYAPRCPLCDQSMETMTHLLTGCSFSRTVWYEVLSWIRSTSGPPTVEGDFAEWWSLMVRTALPAAQGYFVDHHAYGVGNLETSKCCGLR